MSHIHVKDKATGHEYVVREALFDAEKHEKTGKPVLDRHGDLARPKFRTTVGREAEKKARRRQAASEDGSTSEQ